MQSTTNSDSLGQEEMIENLAAESNGAAGFTVDTGGPAHTLNHALRHDRADIPDSCRVPALPPVPRSERVPVGDTV